MMSNDRIVDLCEQKAAEAQREADAHKSAGESGFPAIRERIASCEGRASAFRDVIDALRGAK